MDSLKFSNAPALKRLPETISSLASLTSLILDGCSQLTCLPKGVSSLSRLRSMVIAHNDTLECLPEGISGMRSLTSLMLHDCPQLTSLGDGVSGLPSLRVSSCFSLADQLEDTVPMVSFTLYLASLSCADLFTQPTKRVNPETVNVIPGQLPCIKCFKNLKTMSISAISACAHLAAVWRYTPLMCMAQTAYEYAIS